MMAAAFPLIDLVSAPVDAFYGFRYAKPTAVYFFWFSLPAGCRGRRKAFTLAPSTLPATRFPLHMVAVTVITSASLPIYSVLFPPLWVWSVWLGLPTLALEPNLLALAFLLHYRKMVSLDQLRWDELGKSGLTAVVAGFISLGSSAQRAASRSANGMPNRRCLAAGADH